VVGVAQASVKRMLAYSSIAHGGYLLVALVSANDAAKGAVLFYLLAYAVTNIGAFGVIALMENPGAGQPNDRVKDFAGLWNERPGLAVLMTIFLLSLGGFPPTAGFIAKLAVFSAAAAAHSYALLIVGVVTSVIAAFFYLRVILTMYAAEDADTLQSVYDHLDTALIVRPEDIELTAVLAGVGLALLVAGAIASLAWLGRLP
jgi:NADH-quinone oxidoreductase subunit N